MSRKQRGRTAPGGDNGYDFYSNVVCALTHNIEVCEKCRKCKGENAAEIRTNMIKDLAAVLNKELPWENKDGQLDGH